jgi:iron complex outermembrane receptor protein
MRITHSKASTLAKAIKLACSAAVILSAVSNVQAANVGQTPEKLQASDMQEYNIASQPLAKCLNTLAAQSGIYLSADATITQGKICLAIKGQLSVRQALMQLLSGTGLQAVKQTNGSYLISPVSITNVLATAIVQDDSLHDGSAQEGYRSDANTDIGIWRGRSLQETPYSINVVTEDFIQNIQATSSDQLFKMNPVTQFSWPQAQNDSPYIYTRGFQTGTSSRNGVTRDGYDHGVSMADVAKVEVLTGMSGFLYGAGNIGGMVNYVSKRPTDERFNAVTVGNTSGTNLYAQGDFSGRLGNDGEFGYRLNVLTQDGETAVKDQDAERNFASLALDWQATDNLLIQVDGSFRDYKLNGRQAYWSLGEDENQVSGKALRPDADTIDSDLLWGQTWAYQNTKTERLGANLAWEITDAVSLSAGYLNEEVTRHSALSFNTINADNTYNQSTHTNQKAPHVIDSIGGFVLLDMSFSTGSIEHTLITGYRYSDNKQARFRDGRSNKLKQENLSFTAPTNVAQPTWEEYGVEGSYVRSKWGTENISLGDDIRFNEQWSTLVGLSYANVYAKGFNKLLEPTYSYDESALTPSVSVIYQPRDNITAYVSYMEGLEEGGIASDDEEVINAGEVMKPLISSQYELGAKLDIDGMLLTAAIFEIDKGLEYYKDVANNKKKLVQDGRQVHRGVEFTATGKITDNLTLVGGFTLLDAESNNQKVDTNLEGKVPKGVAEKMAKLYGEYTIAAVPGLVINGGFNYTGDFYGDVGNTDKLDAYTLVDIGARYAINIAEQALTFRLNVNNLTDHRYWANDRYLGDGRRVTFSANIEF